MRVRGRDDRGAVAILVAVFALVMFGLAAIVVDLGMLRVTKADVLATADAAALAGAAELYDETVPTPRFVEAVEAVKDSAAGNGTPREDWNTCTAPLPGPRWLQVGSGTNCILFDSVTSPRRVQVVTPSRRVEAAFGGVLGYSGSDIGASAQAQARDRRMQDCSLCVDGPLTVDGGLVEVSGDGSAIAGRGQVSGSGGSIVVTGEGGIGFETFPPSPLPPSPRYSPQPEQASPEDPFAGAIPPVLPPPPPPSTNRIRDTTCGTGQTLQTGRAFGDVTITGACGVTGGTVFVTGRLRVNTDAWLTGTATTLYFTCRQGNEAQSCSSGESSRGRLEVQAGGQLSLSGSSLSASSRPLSVFYDLDNGAALTVAGELVVTGGSVYNRSGGASVEGSVDVVDGLFSVADLSVGSGARLGVRATGLGARSGPYRLALVK